MRRDRPVGYDGAQAGPGRQHRLRLADGRRGDGRLATRQLAVIAASCPDGLGMPAADRHVRARQRVRLNAAALEDRNKDIQHGVRLEVLLTMTLGRRVGLAIAAKTVGPHSLVRHISRASLYAVVNAQLAHRTKRFIIEGWNP